ncbi:MAG: hypothetical protein ABI839_03360 [Verrucomicrobiota bacterium]
MLYHFTLQMMALVTGLILFALGVVGFIAKSSAFASLNSFPRSRWAGIVLLTVALIWSFWLLSTMEMGEFSAFRRPLLIALPLAYACALRFMDEFLAVRALGILALLAAEPLLDAAFLRYETSRLVLTVLAYILIVLGLLWVMMPYMLRDQISWFSHSLGRWRALTAAGILYGITLIALALLRY